MGAMKDSMMELQDLMQQMSTRHMEQAQALVRATEILQLVTAPQMQLQPQPKMKPWAKYEALEQIDAAEQAVFAVVEADSRVGKRTSLAFLAARLVKRDKRNVTLEDQLRVRQLLVQWHGADAWIGDQQCCIRSLRDGALRGEQ